MKRGVEVKGELVSVEELQDENSESGEEFDDDDESLENEDVGENHGRVVCGGQAVNSN